jgi:hypothetical protein
MGESRGAISDEERHFFNEHGWLRRPQGAGIDAATLSGFVDEVAAFADGGPGLHYREMTDAGPKLCRSEDFTPSHAGLRALLRSGAVASVTSALLGEEAVLYKEKVNYKLVGGAGYAPHQDAPAYPFLERHISCMIAVDPATIANGCLEVVSGLHHELLPMDAAGCIDPDVVATLRWEPAELDAGDVLWFHSRTPHRSGPNTSRADRRAIYPTYNAASEGDLRDRYYEAKAEELARADAEGRVVVSLIGDFQGRAV